MLLYFILVLSIESHTLHEYLLVRNLPNNQQNISNFLETKTTFKYLLNINIKSVINQKVLPIFVNKKVVKYFTNMSRTSSMASTTCITRRARKRETLGMLFYHNFTRTHHKPQTPSVILMNLPSHFIFPSMMCSGPQRQEHH